MGYRTVPLTCRIFGYGLLFLLVPACIEGSLPRFPPGPSRCMFANLLFLGLLASATCFVTWNRAVFLLGPVKTSAYIYATPVITIVSSALILHEAMTPVMGWARHSPLAASSSPSTGTKPPAGQAAFSFYALEKYRTNIR